MRRQAGSSSGRAAELDHTLRQAGEERTSATWQSGQLQSAIIYVGGLDKGLTEGDVICVFSQYGEVLNIDLVRSKETGESNGFAFLKYDDQRSTILAVDNLHGAKVVGRQLRVDYAPNYRRAVEISGRGNAAPELFCDKPKETTASASAASPPPSNRTAAVEDEDPMAAYFATWAARGENADPSPSPPPLSQQARKELARPQWEAPTRERRPDSRPDRRLSGRSSRIRDCIQQPGRSHRSRSRSRSRNRNRDQQRR